MLIRSLAVAAAAAGVAGLLLCAQSPPFGIAPDVPLIGLAGLGLVTLRSEGRRQAVHS